MLERLRAGDPEAWNDTFRTVYPVAFESARLRLGESLIHDCEDVAMDTLRDVFEQVSQVNSEDELRPLAFAIARNKATDFVRRQIAEKRGGGNVQSLDALTEDAAQGRVIQDQNEVLDEFTIGELRGLLVALSAEVKKEYRIVLRDRYFHGLQYSEIAEKRGISIGSVGVYLERGLAAMRSAISRSPRLHAELLEVMSDTVGVRTLLPAVSAIQLGGAIHDGEDWEIRPMVGTRGGVVESHPVERQMSDDDRLLFSSEELSEPCHLDHNKAASLLEILKRTLPARFEAWEKIQSDVRLEQEQFQIERARREKWNNLLGWLILGSLASALVYGLVRLVRWLFS